MEYNCLDYLKNTISTVDQRNIPIDYKNYITENRVFLHEIHYKTDMPKIIELGNAVDFNPYHFYFYMIARFYFFDTGENDIIFYYENGSKYYFPEAALAMLPSRFKREKEKRDCYEYIEMPGCYWYEDIIDEKWMYSYVANLYKHIWKDIVKEKGKFTYISRKKGFTKLRRIMNEDDLYRPLKEIGFSIYYLEDLTFDQQVKLFRSSEIITSMHGGGLAHIIFCEPNTLICEINNELTPYKNHYKYISNNCNHRYYRYMGADPIKTDGSEDVFLHIPGYINALEHIKTLC
jgi:hypothetical protein